METTKTCIKCNTTKNLTEYRFDKFKQKHLNICILCEKEYHKEYRKKNKDTIKANKKIKYNLHIEENREKAREYYHKNKELISEKKKKYYIDNINYFKEKREAYYISNKDNILNNRKMFYLLNKDILKKKRMDYYYNNISIEKATKKKYYEKNKHKIIEKVNEYRKTDFGKISYKNSKHKRRSLLKDGNINSKDIEKMSKSKCYWCDNKIINNNYHIDHYIPLSKGGVHRLENIVISCPKCNMQKSNKDPYKFALSVGKLL